MYIGGDKYLVACAEFCAEKLGITHFTLQMKWAKKGETSNCTCHEDGDFTIEIQKNLDTPRVIVHVAHEMVHLRQFKHDELDVRDESTYWKGERYDTPEFGSDEYWLSPWEIEARALEGWLQNRWEEAK